MIPSYLLPQRAVHKRLNANLVQNTYPFSQVLTGFVYEVPAFVQGGTEDANTDVDVVVHGELDGITQSESFVVSAASTTGRSEKKYSKINDVSSITAGLGTLTLRAVYGDGSDAVVENIIKSVEPGRLREDTRPIQVDSQQGTIFTSRWIWYTNNFDTREADILIIDDVTYEVEGIYKIYDTGGLHHLAVKLQKL